MGMVGWFRKIAPIATTPVQQIATTPAIHNKIQEAAKSQLQPQQSLPFLSNFNLRIIFDVKLILFLIKIGRHWDPRNYGYPGTGTGT